MGKTSSLINIQDSQLSVFKRKKEPLTLNSTLKYIKYVYAEISVTCLAILVKISWLVLYFWKIIPVRSFAHEVFSDVQPHTNEKSSVDIVQTLVQTLYSKSHDAMQL